MADPDKSKSGRSLHYPSLFDLARFVLYSGVIFLVALLAGAGHVAYTLVMLLIAAALVYAVLDLIDMEIVKRKRRPRARL